jgi:RibD C-terminal domain
MYETMVFWETVSTEADEPAVFWDYAGIWRGAEKIVYSRSLSKVSSARTRIEREFDLAAIQDLKETSDADIAIGGPELAGQAIAAGLVDDCHLFLNPIVVGGGKRALPDQVHTASAPGRAPIRERRRPPPLSHERLTDTARQRSSNLSLAGRDPQIREADQNCRPRPGLAVSKRPDRSAALLLLARSGSDPGFRQPLRSNSAKALSMG